MGKITIQTTEEKPVLETLQSTPKHLERHKWIFEQHFYKRRSYPSIAREKGISSERARQLALRWGRHLKLDRSALIRHRAKPTKLHAQVPPLKLESHRYHWFIDFTHLLSLALGKFFFKASYKGHTKSSQPAEQRVSAYDDEIGLGEELEHR